MKTLDEVIKEQERCNTYPNCHFCYLHSGSICSWIRDALHYLKTIETTENLYHDAVNELSKWKDEDWKDRCLPLTWDELQTMEGKPVWVEGSAFAGGFWTIITGFGKSGNADYIFFLGDQYWREDMQDAEDGLSWQAYRKERL